MSCVARAAKLVDRAFVRELSARDRDRLRVHLRACDYCRGRWERLASIDRQLAGPRLGKMALEDIEGRVTSARPRPRRLAWALGAAVAASVVLLAVILRPTPEHSAFTARGTPSPGRTPGVRAFCVAGEGDHVRAEVRLVSQGTAPELRCSIEDDLQLAYTTPDREGLTMVAFARRASALIRYTPSDGASAMPVIPDRIDELIPWSTHLATEHQPGTYDLVVRISDHTDSIVELHATLDVAPGGTLAP